MCMNDTHFSSHSRPLSKLSKWLSGYKPNRIHCTKVVHIPALRSVLLRHFCNIFIYSLFNDAVSNWNYAATYHILKVETTWPKSRKVSWWSVSQPKCETFISRVQLRSVATWANSPGDFLYSYPVILTFFNRFGILALLGYYSALIGIYRHCSSTLRSDLEG